MNKAEELLNHFLSRPKYFIYNDLLSLMSSSGYREIQESSSRIVFSNENLKHSLKLHNPQPGFAVKRYQIDLIIQELKSQEMK